MEKDAADGPSVSRALLLYYLHESRVSRGGDCNSRRVMHGYLNAETTGEREREKEGDPQGTSGTLSLWLERNVSRRNVQMKATPSRESSMRSSAQRLACIVSAKYDNSTMSMRKETRRGRSWICHFRISRTICRRKQHLSQKVCHRC